MCGRLRARYFFFGDGIPKTPSERCLTRRSLIRSGAAHQRALIWSVLEYDVSLSKTELRAAQPSVHRRCNRRLNAAAFRGPRRKYFRWGKAMRPRKHETLSRHGLGARRVALLAPRGVLSKYRHPLSYVGARPKLFSRGGKLIPHFGRRQAYSEWGRSPGGEEGVCHSHVRGR